VLLEYKRAILWSQNRTDKQSKCICEINVIHFQVPTSANLAPGVYLQAFTKQVASWSVQDVWHFPGLVHVKTIAVFITHVQ